MQMPETTSGMEYREFVITGKVWSGSNEQAKHSLFWSIRNSEWDSEIEIEQIKINERVNQNG